MAKSNLKRADAAGKPDFADLSFVGTRTPTKDNISKRDFWVIAETGDWGKDNQIGRAAAIELAKFMTQRDNSTLLGDVVCSMIEKGRYRGVEVGFLHFFGAHALNSFVNEYEVNY